MKVWQGYGSEHSSAIVMIGRFKSAEKARNAETVMEKIVNLATKEGAEDPRDWYDPPRRFTDEMRTLLHGLRQYDISPVEIEQFIFDVRVSRENNVVEIATEESDISAFLKVLISSGARVEVYSAHDYPDGKDEESSSGSDEQGEEDSVDEVRN